MLGFISAQGCLGKLKAPVDRGTALKSMFPYKSNSSQPTHAMLNAWWRPLPEDPWSRRHTHSRRGAAISERHMKLPKRLLFWTPGFIFFWDFLNLPEKKMLCRKGGGACQSSNSWTSFISFFKLLAFSFFQKGKLEEEHNPAEFECMPC